MAVKGNTSKRYPNSGQYDEGVGKVAENHISNKANPHGVTAEQAGAAEKEHEHAIVNYSESEKTGSINLSDVVRGGIDSAVTIKDNKITYESLFDDDYGADVPILVEGTIDMEVLVLSDSCYISLNGVSKTIENGGSFKYSGKVSSLSVSLSDGEVVFEKFEYIPPRAGFMSPEMLAMLLSAVSKEALDKILESYYDASDIKAGYYDKTEVKALIDGVRVIVDQEYSKDSGNAQSGKAVAQAIAEEVAKIINSSPEALNTLSELASALGNDPNFATTVMTEIGKKANAADVYSKAVMDSRLSGKVDVGAVLTPSETEAMFLRYNSQVNKEVDHKIAVSEANIDKKIADNQTVVSGFKDAAESAASEAKEAKADAETAATNAQVLVDQANARLDNVYSKDESDGLFASKGHGHEAASYEKGVSISLIGITTASDPDITTITDGSITINGTGNCTIDYRGNVDLSVFLGGSEARRALVFVDGVAAPIDSSTGTRNFAGEVKEKISVKSTATDGVTFTFNRFWGDKYTDGLMTGEDKEKLDDTYRKGETLSKEETASAISEAVASLVDSSPETLDTLKEVAAALGDDPNFATTIMTLLGEKANAKDVYTSAQTDAAISEAIKGKANSADVAAALEKKADAENVYSKDETGELLGKKADKSEVANAIKGNVSGEIVQLSDVSPIAHDIKVKCSPGAKVTRAGKNLIPFPYPGFSYNAGAGITAAIRDDGGILINGTATAAVFINLVRTVRYGNTDILPTNTNGIITNGDTKSVYCRYDVANTSTYIYVKSGTVCDNVVFYPQLEVGNISTEYEKGTSHVVYMPDADGNIEIPALYPTTTLFTDVDGAIIEAEYNKDLNKTFGDIDSALDAILAIQESLIGDYVTEEATVTSEGGDAV